MKPLRDTEGGSPLLERAKSLLEAAPPLPESRERMLRVRRALDVRRGVWVYLGRLPAAAMAALIVLFGASAFAAVRVVAAWQESRAEGAARPIPVPSAVPSATRTATTTTTTTTTTTAIPIPIPIPTPIPIPIPIEEGSPTTVEKVRPGESARSSRATRRASGTRTSHVTHDTSPEAIARATDSELVHRAAKALRSEHDPALAARLLEAHRARSPSGPLAEEALSLQVEALTALGSARAAVLAREYLARYPGGRYTSVATRALGDPTR